MAASNIIGVDLGGTKIALARYDAKTLERTAEERVPTHAQRGFTDVIEDVVKTVEKLRDANTEGVGIGVPGLIRQPAGIVLNTPNIPGGKNIALKEQLSKRLNLRVEVENDANCFALAEAVMGSGKGHDIVLGITLGTGVGGGIIIGEKIYRGHNGFAAEFGHMLLMPGFPPFKTDDARGEVEQFLSGTAMGRRCAEADTPQDYLDGEVCSYLQPMVFREIAWFVTNLIYLLDPSVIVFGGSAGLALRTHLTQIIAELKHWTLPGTPLPALAVAQVPDAGMLGAALAARG